MARSRSGWPWWATALLVALVVLPFLLFALFVANGWNIVETAKAWLQSRQNGDLQ